MADKIKDGKGTAKKWQQRIRKEIKAHDDYRKKASESDVAARDEAKRSHQFNIHWSNSKIIKSSIYASRPKPDVRRRFAKNPNPTERELARMVERGLEFNLDNGSWDEAAPAIAQDFVRAATGVPRVIYEVTTSPIPDILDSETAGEAQLMASFAGEDVVPTFEQGLTEITLQAVDIEHVPWRHFHWEPGHSSWSKVNWTAYDVYMTKKDILDEYGVDLTSSSGSQSEADNKRKAQDYEDEILVHEIWDKTRREIIVIASGHDDLLDRRKDELNLRGFYPSPRPAFDNLKSDEIIPKPDYAFVEPQIKELNRVTQRRHRLVEQIKAVRLYDPLIAEALGKLENSSDAANIPVTNMAALLDSSSGRATFEKVLVDLPMADRIQVVRELTGQANEIKQEIYEILGIADIVRGQSNASETLGAQELKGQWASVRISDKTIELNRVWKDVFRIMAEIICERFTDEQLYLMTGVEVTPDMRQMMESDVLRLFAIDVETDSTILKDDNEERQQKMELVNVLLEKISQVIPYVQNAVLPIEFLQEVLLFSVSSYKHSKQLEEAIHGIIPSMQTLQDVQQLQQKLQQMQAQMQQQGDQAQKAVQQVQQEAGKAVESAQAQAAQQVQDVHAEAGKAIQDLQNKLSAIDMREQERKDAQVRADIETKETKAEAERQKAEHQKIQNHIDRVNLQVAIAEKRAELNKIKAETRNIDADTEGKEIEAEISALETLIQRDTQETIQ